MWSSRPFLIAGLLWAASASAAETVTPPGCEDPASPAAIVAGSPVTLAEVDQRALSAVLDAREALYQARRAALDELVGDALFAKEAAARGISLEALLKAEVEDKVPQPTAAEIDEVYEQAKTQPGIPGKAELTPRIVDYLRGERLDEARATFLGSLETRYGVQRLLEPPRVAVSADDDAVRGPAEAPVTIVEFSDYQCPFCAKVEPTLAALRERYGDQIRLVYRDFPLPFHANAQRAAEASECAGDQGRFWEMHDAMFADQSKLGEADLVDTAVRLGLAKKPFKACLASHEHADEVAADVADAEKAGITGTPVFFVDGVPLRGAMPLAAFTEAVDAALARHQPKAPPTPTPTRTPAPAPKP